MNSVLQRVYEIGIIPVIAFNSVDEALPAPPVPKSASRRFTKNCPRCCWAPAPS